MPAQKNRNRPASPTGPAAAPASGSFPAPGTPPALPARLGGTELAEYLRDPQRSRTVVVISHLPRNPLRYDAAALTAMLAGGAEVYELANGIETRKLESGLGDDMHIFGNAARVYPCGLGWTTRISSPHLLHHAGQLPALYEKIEMEVLAAEHAGRPAAAPATASLPVVAEARVLGFPSADRAMVEMAADGTQAVIRSEDLLPDIPIDWLVSKGQVLSGVLDAAAGTFDVRGLVLPPLSPIKKYRHGDVAMARVVSVRPDHATVLLWPGSTFRIGVADISSNDLDSAEDLLTEDEVVRVRVHYDNGAVRLSMLDVDDDEAAVPAPPLLRGGPPWLDPERPYASIPHRGAPVSVPAPCPAAGAGATLPTAVGHGLDREPPTAAERRTALKTTQLELDSARHTIDELLAETRKKGATDQLARVLQDQVAEHREAAADLARRLNDAERQLAAVKEELARTKASLVQSRQRLRADASRSEKAAGPLFLEPDKQFHYELTQAWAETVPPHDKASHTLGTYRLGQHFLASWSVLTEPQRVRALRAVVDLVADRQGPLRKREPHHLRSNEGAHAAAVMRGHDVCMRLYVEQKTPGALRLHYWKLAGGGLELHEVVPHDVVKP
ncbi:hypothetical protein JOF48_000614 [Arthrobacter stackebrandtii]|uniref:S1 motif domain-containing protein n=1 Tax=Arthrobacter stackebrandtii TaxID=272161 RepID=A0ABS4YTM7_9MICC|nr:hypothetical protein [Arthrobacter stackebrandtii]MBP2411815.1 hypothetical protein [Arthrobacter stackebrandtii]PYG99203.1 hypothetical protein CVV67_16765 [Arthrobacter stackebrandtii]